MIVYATIILLLFVTANIYLKFQDMHTQLVRVARKVAIQDGLIQNPEWTKEN
ncbi:MAG: DUF2304 family protein [Candidatus Fonsibacter sp.]